MKKASAILDEFNIPYEMVIASAHRTPEAVKSFVERLEQKEQSPLSQVQALQPIYLEWWQVLQPYLLSVFLLMQRH